MAAAITTGDVLLPNDLGVEDLAEELQLGLAGRRNRPGHPVDGAVVFAEAELSVGTLVNLAEVALLVLDHRQLANPFGQGSPLPHPGGDPPPEAIGQLAAADGEHLVDELGATRLLQCRDETGGQPVVVGGKEGLSLSGDVVDVTGSAHAVADGGPGDETGALQSPELLENARPTRSQEGGQLVGGRRAVAAEAQEDRLAKGGR